MKILVEKYTDGRAYWRLVSGTATLARSGNTHANTKAARESAKILQEAMFPPPVIEVRRVRY